MDEAEAVERAKQHDLTGLEALVQLHQQAAVRLAAFITHDRQLAEDVVSDSFLVAYEHMAQFDERRPFRPWFHRIVANAALKAIRRRKRLIRLDDESDDTTQWLCEVARAGSDALEAADQAGAREAVQKAVAALSPRQRAVVALRYFSGFNEAETAAALGIPRGTVKSRLAAGLQRLRVLLAHWREDVI